MRQIRTDTTSNIASRKTRDILRNRHFWIITCVMTVLALLYNASYLGITGWFPWAKDIVSAQGVYIFVLSFLFFIPLVHASVVFRLQGTMATWFVFLAAILPRAIQDSPSFESLLRTALVATVALLLGLFVALDYNPSLKDNGASKRTRFARWAPLARMLKVQEYERRRVARKLHDNTIQSLLVIANRARALESGDYGRLSPKARKQAEEIMIMLLHAIDDVRRLSRELRPSTLDNVGLLPTLRWLTENLSHESGIKINMQIKGKAHSLPPEFEVIFFRIAQDALNNVVRHSAATAATVTLDFVASNFKMTVEDNGQGFLLADDMGDFAAEGKLGLQRMEQQASLLDGSFKVSSQPGKGTFITIEATP
ncbi:MAG: sensor histidine kinase [Chloroflexota bacterium]|nr:MAG: sensor histidine kinase [Chloroflexota bacterium]